MYVRVTFTVRFGNIMCGCVCGVPIDEMGATPYVGSAIHLMNNGLIPFGIVVIMTLLICCIGIVLSLCALHVDLVPRRYLFGSLFGALVDRCWTTSVLEV